MTILFRSHLSWLLIVVTGAILMTIGLTSLHSAGGLRHDRNPMGIYRSAYGKLMARLSESTVDRVWHLGVEQIVPHNIDGSQAHTTVPGAVENPDEEDATYQTPAVERVKDWFHNMRVVKYTRTNPYSLNKKHLATVKKDVELMLLRSYKMDPGHYGAYDSYHLFLTTHSYGGTEASRQHAVKIANATIGYVSRENEDPEPWLTAATAAMNLYILEAEPYSDRRADIPLEILKKYRSQMGYCLQRFEELQARAEENGNWDNLSYDRQIEINHRFGFSKRTFKQFDTLIARAEEANPPAIPDSEVADKADKED